MLQCVYNDNKSQECSLLLLLSIHCHSHNWCKVKCWPNHVSAQLAMLRRFAPDFPAPPEGKDLLEWAKEKIADGTVPIPGAKERAEQAEQQREKREAEQAELLAIAEELKLPNPAEQVVNLGRHLREVRRFKKATGRKYVTDEWFEARNDMCAECPSERMKLVVEVMLCADCGCCLNKGKSGIAAKNRYEALPCSREHHDAIDAAFRARLGLDLPAEPRLEQDSNRVEPAFNDPLKAGE